MDIVKTDFFDSLADDALHNEDWVFANENVDEVQTKPIKRQRETVYRETDLSFGDLGLSKPLIRACEASGFLSPTKIQAQAIPLILKGSDTIICAQTGSGKTGAFTLPLLHKLLYRNKRLQATRCLILSPTRELSQQIYSMVRTYTRHTDLTIKVVIGGANSARETRQLQEGPDVLIATPGRLLDHIKNSKDVSFENLEFLVFDEADKLLDMGFVTEVKEILSELPTNRKTILASATMTEGVEKLAALALKRPIRVGKGRIPSALKHLLVRMKDEWNRDAVLLYLIKNYISSNLLVFYRTKADCHKMAVYLNLLGHKVAEIHGSLTQSLRLQALRQFQAAEVDILLATDLAARGLDLPVDAVINMGFPDTPEKFLHRIGRTARAGQEGLSITLVDTEERTKLRKTLKTGVPAIKIDSGKFAEATELIEKFKHKVKILLAEERMEKELEKAEKEAERGGNLIKYREEIYSRPKKEWIQKPKVTEEKKVVQVPTNKVVERNIDKHKAMVKHYKTAAKGLQMLTKKKQPKKKSKPAKRTKKGRK